MIDGHLSQAQLDELKARNPCDQVAAQWVKLRRGGRGFVGPCPLHSRDPEARDSTSFECDGEGWVCASCSDGGDVIKLVMLREGVPFREAVARLGGAVAIDPERERAAAEAREQRALEREADGNKYRENERLRAWDIYHYGGPIDGTIGERYLRDVRGLDLPPRVRLRFDDKARLYAPDRPAFRLVHTGPALLALIQRAGVFAGVHVTFLDLAQDKGKARIVDPKTGELLPSKKMRGSKKGGHIDLTGCREPRTLIVGEGIEKVLAVWSAIDATMFDHQIGFWTSADLGNMGGKALASVPHPRLKTPTGRVKKVPGPVPDMDDPALIIPDSVDRLVLLGDSTSDRFTTECVMARAAARYARPGRTIVVAWAPDGMDFDDMLRGLARGSAERAAALQRIFEIVTAAAPPALPASSAAADPQPETKVAPRKRRGRSALAAADAAPAALADAAANSGQPPDPPDPPAPPLAPAAAAASPQNEPSSQTGGSAEKIDRRRGAGRAVSARRDRGGGGGMTPEDRDALDLRLAYFPQTDLGNAERFRERYRGRLIWCATIGWLWWDGRRWCRDGADERVRQAEHATVRGIQDEADAVARSGQDEIVDIKNEGKKNEYTVKRSDLLRAWGRNSENNSRLVPISKQASAYLAVAPAQLDADPFKINVRNGTLSVARRDDDQPYVEFYPHDPADLITKLAPVDYDADAACPRYDQFLAEVQAKPEMRRFLHQWKGLALTGDVSEQRLCVFYGKGKNGKSVFEDTTAHIAGDYCETVPIETFLAEGRGRNAGQATPDLAILPGVRMLRTSEPKRNATLDEGLIKLATGGEPIIARHLNRDYFKFYPQFKLTISGNYRPKIEGADDGIWRRMVLVPWTYTVPQDKRDRHLIDKLKREGSGILNRLIEGLCDWLDHGLVLPEDVDRATDDYRQDSDPLGRFLAACTRRSPGGRVQATVLHELFVGWARSNSATEWSPRGLALAMKERGYQNTKSSVSYWLDLELTARLSQFVDSQGKPTVRREDDGDADDGDAAAAGRDDSEGAAIL